jgi:hypothetical protein
MGKNMKLPTDLRLLKFIYKKYYGVFISFSKEEKTRATKIFVPVSIKEIAIHFNVDEDIIFGRLYYYLNKKYGYRDEDNSLVSIFASLNEDGHCVNFALLSSVLASLQEDNSRFWTTTIIAFYATVLAAIAVIVSLIL